MDFRFFNNTCFCEGEASVESGSSERQAFCDFISSVLRGCEGAPFRQRLEELGLGITPEEDAGLMSLTNSVDRTKSEELLPISIYYLMNARFSKHSLMSEANDALYYAQEEMLKRIGCLVVSLVKGLRVLPRIRLPVVYHILPGRNDKIWSIGNRVWFKTFLSCLTGFDDARRAAAQWGGHPYIVVMKDVWGYDVSQLNPEHHSMVMLEPLSVFDISNVQDSPDGFIEARYVENSCSISFEDPLCMSSDLSSALAVDDSFREEDYDDFQDSTSSAQGSVPLSSNPISFDPIVSPRSPVPQASSSVPPDVAMREAKLAIQVGDFDRAEQYLSPLARGGAPDACYELAVLVLDGNVSGYTIDQARGMLEVATRAGHEEALCELGICYRNGVFGAEDLRKAADLFKQGHERGISRCTLYYANALLNGTGVPENKKMAFNLYMGLAKQGNVPGMLKLAKCYDNGYGVRENEDEALHWNIEAANRGDPDGLYLAGVTLLERENKTDMHVGIAYLQQATNSGHGRAAYALSRAYEYGTGVERDESKAFSYMKKSAELGCDVGMNGLGRLYKFGIGVEKDMKEAFNWDLRAAEAGYPSAMFAVGGFYFQGTVVPRDEKKGLEWDMKAAEHGNNSAKAVIGSFYINGNHLPQDIQKGLDLIRESAQSECPEGLYQLGRYLLEGKIVRKNEKEALKLLRNAKKRGHRLAAETLKKYGE